MHSCAELSRPLLPLPPADGQPLFIPALILVAYFQMSRYGNGVIVANIILGVRFYIHQ